MSCSLNCTVGLYAQVEGLDACVPCPVGRFTDVPGTVTCKLCPSGMSNPLTSQSVCSECGLGKFTAAPGALVCGECKFQFCPVHPLPSILLLPHAICAGEPGKYANSTRQTACQQCPRGTQQAAVARSSCLACEAGRYTDDVGLGACKQCDEGKTQPSAGKSTCNLCAAGRFQRDKGGSNECESPAVSGRACLLIRFFPLFRIPRWRLPRWHVLGSARRLDVHLVSGHVHCAHCRLHALPQLV